MTRFEQGRKTCAARKSKSTTADDCCRSTLVGRRAGWSWVERSEGKHGSRGLGCGLRPAQLCLLHVESANAELGRHQLRKWKCDFSEVVPGGLVTPRERVR